MHIQYFVIAAALIALGGCQHDPAAHEASLRAADEKVWANSPDPKDAHVDEIASQSSSQRDDWRLAGDLAERSYKQTPDLVNEFNLATSYQNTGRVALAIPLYIDLVERGQYVHTAPLFKNDGTWPVVMKETIADEAARRLVRMGVDPKMVQPAGTVASAVK